MISQPYIIAIILFITLRKFNHESLGFMIILCGLLYDLIIGGLIGIHSLLFILIKFFTINFNNSKKILKKYGEWFLFSFSYIIGLLIMKVIFVIVTFKFPDINAIFFNIGTTLLLFPAILFLIDAPKVVYRVFIK